MTNTMKLTFASISLALCFCLPMITANQPQIGAALCLMHFPVMVCGMMCGAPWGVAVGVSAPILRSLMFNMPPMYPEAVAMCIEMGVYGLVCGLEANDPRRSPGKIFMDLIAAMIAGRLVWGGVMIIFDMISTVAFTPADYYVNVINTWPGIILQLMSLPPLIVFLQTAYYPDDIEAL